MRGKANRVIGLVGGYGITPACAGKSKEMMSEQSLIWDHPRVCGEKAAQLRAGFVGRGSPPRVRGKVPGQLHRFRLGRITPACAGKSFRLCPLDFQRWDHPRVCGEKFLNI